MWQYSIAPRTRKYVKGYGFLLFTKKKTKKKHRTKCFQKVVHKAKKLRVDRTKQQHNSCKFCDY